MEKKGRKTNKRRTITRTKRKKGKQNKNKEKRIIKKNDTHTRTKNRTEGSFVLSICFAGDFLPSKTRTRLSSWCRVKRGGGKRGKRERKEEGGKGGVRKREEAVGRGWMVEVAMRGEPWRGRKEGREEEEEEGCRGDGRKGGRMGRRSMADYYRSMEQKGNKIIG